MLILFYTLLLSSGALATAPDTLIRPPVYEQVKLGLRAFSPADITFSYERQLANRWSVAGGVGYYGWSSRTGTIFYDYDGTTIEDSYTTKDRIYSFDLQLRRYFRRRTPRPLAGWFMAANLHTFLRHSVQQHTYYTERNYDISGVLTQLELHLGRQWALGRRITLDTYGGVSLGQAYLSSGRPRTTRRGLTSGFGVQVGYRFQPLTPHRP